MVEPDRALGRVHPERQVVGDVAALGDLDEDLGGAGRVARPRAIAPLADAPFMAPTVSAYASGMSWTVIDEPAQSVRKPLGSTTITLHAERRGLGAQHPAEAVDRELGGLVGGDAGRAADAAAHGRDLHDEAAALLAQHRDGRLRDVVDAPEVGLELGAEVLVVAGLDGRDVGVAGVVDDHVEAAEPLARLGDRRAGARLGVGDVESDGLDASAVLGDEVVELLGPAGGGGDAVAGLRARRGPGRGRGRVRSR